MKKLISILIAICALTLFSGTALAAEPIDELTTNMTIPVTIDDVTAVADQLGEHENDIEMMASLMWNECRGVPRTCEKAAVPWTVLNRVEDDRWPDTIAAVITQSGQFAHTGKPSLDSEGDKALYEELRSIAKDVIMRWLFEKQGIESVGRVLPKEYVFFAGHGGRNWFRTGDGGGRYWMFGLPDPYADDEEEAT